MKPLACPRSAKTAIVRSEIGISSVPRKAAECRDGWRRGDALYYARVLEAPSAALNGRPLETEFDADGEPISIAPCTLERVDRGGCPGLVSERAWSAPIFVDQPARTTEVTAAAATEERSDPEREREAG